jgi:hypothetical protein
VVRKGSLMIESFLILAVLATTACSGSTTDPGDLSSSATGDTIQAPPAPPAAASLVSECDAPEPAWIWCDDFEEDRLASYFEYNSADGDFVREGGVGVESSSGMRGSFREGREGAGWLHLAFGRTPQSFFRAVDSGAADYRDVYWRFLVRNEPTWTGGGGHKLSRATVFASENTWAQAMIAHVWSGGSDGSHHYLVLDPASGTDEAGELATTKYNDFENLRWLGVARGTTPLFNPDMVGSWHCIEARVRLNDPGSSNGLFRMWIDGIEQPGRDDLNWVGSFDRYGINAVYLENYWNDGAPKDQERYLDNFVVSTERIGCN